MEIAAFAEIIHQRLSSDPSDELLPVLLFPERCHIMVLQGVPAEKAETMREIALTWATSKMKSDEEFLVAFPDGEGYFRIIRRTHERLHEALFPKKKPNKPLQPTPGSVTPRAAESVSK